MVMFVIPNAIRSQPSCDQPDDLESSKQEATTNVESTRLDPGSKLAPQASRMTIDSGFKTIW